MGCDSLNSDKRNRKNEENYMINQNIAINNMAVNNVYYSNSLNIPNRNINQNFPNEKSNQNINTRKIKNINYSNGCCCPCCGEPAGKDFIGDNKFSYNCLKCGESYFGNCYSCRKCGAIFCHKCPFKQYSNLACCPACGQGLFGGNECISYDCLKCGKGYYGNCYYCSNCRGIFCHKCPYL